MTSPETENLGKLPKRPIDALYDACFIDEFSFRVHLSTVQNVVLEQSAAETIAWPAVKNESNAKTQPAKRTELTSFDQICYIFAVLICWEYRDGGAIAAMRFIVEDESNEEAWKLCCKSVFSTKQLQCHGSRVNEAWIHAVWETQTHFLTICWTACQSVHVSDTRRGWFQKTVVNCVSGLRLWLYMPSHYRELEIRRQPRSIRNIWNNIIKEKSNGGENPSVFIVCIIVEFLDVIEGTILTNNCRESNSEFKRKKNQDHETEGRIVNPIVRSTDDNSGDESLSEVTWGWRFVLRSLELLIDVLSSPIGDVRRYLVPYMTSIHWIVRCRNAFDNNLFSRSNDNFLLTQQLIERIVRCIHFPVEAIDSSNQLKALDSVDLRSIHYRRAGIVQKICGRHFSDKLPDVIYAGVGLLCSPTFLRQQAFQVLKDRELLDLLHKLRLIDSHESGVDSYNRMFLMAVLENFLVVPKDIAEDLRTFPLFPTETVLWNFSLIPPSHSSLLPSEVLSLPKLQTRFLSFADYLLRNFELVRLESAYEIRSDLVDAVRRLRPIARQEVSEKQESLLCDGSLANTGMKTTFSGWARMAMELSGIIEVKKILKPLLGDKHFSSVTAEFSIDLAPCGEQIRKEWDGLSEHDVLFLVAIDATQVTGKQAPLLKRPRWEHSDSWKPKNTNDARLQDEDDPTFPARFGVQLVRGCRIVSVRDDSGTIVSDSNSSATAVGTKRFFMVELDSTQFAYDTQTYDGTNFYQSINLVVRRHGKTNNFRSVLETIRGLLIGMGSIGRAVPSWLQLVLLGHGNPTDASFKFEKIHEYAAKTVGVANLDDFLDYGDTFMDEEHLRSCFTLHPLAVVSVDGRKRSNDSSGNHGFRCNYRVRFLQNYSSGDTSIEALSYPINIEGKGNPIRFTALQVEAIRSGLSPGLTLVVGPPGTGKSDTAVQIIACLFHSFPTQRTVIIAHSNAALNDLFQKVMARGDIPERYLVRLGAGERNLESDSTHDFTKAGRVAYCLHRRNELLGSVQRLAESLGVSAKSERGKDGSSAYTCASAEFFYRNYVQKKICIFDDAVKDKYDYSVDAEVAEYFPFASYFEITDKSIRISEARDYFRSINRIFQELSEYRPFELLRSQRQRSEYIIIKQARIVAMTCTHAAIARSHLIELDFEYDNVIMEEAGQMLEIESFIPLLLQRGEIDSNDSGISTSRLKRLCLMGDHNQLPPVIQNVTFAKYSNLDQSLFSRLIRSGVPYIQLDKQGRCRPEIAKLFSWRYDNLGDLDHVLKTREFKLSNPGMAHCVQVVNVDDFDGKGESCPTPYFYQNAGEAEFVVATFQYLVLIGYAPTKISILSSYNGQKELINDVLSYRCGEGTTLCGVRPQSVSTIDQYQGQQNDIVLLSLVRTNSLGHLRDVRRLTVAVSRARLGLYVFCRLNLFLKCHELKPTLDQLCEKPTKLQLVIGETFPTDRSTADIIPKNSLYEIDNAIHMCNLVHKMQEDLLAQSNEVGLVRSTMRLS